MTNLNVTGALPIFQLTGKQVKHWGIQSSSLYHTKCLVIFLASQINIECSSICVRESGYENIANSSHPRSQDFSRSTSGMSRK